MAITCLIIVNDNKLNERCLVYKEPYDSDYKYRYGTRNQIQNLIEDIYDSGHSIEVQDLVYVTEHKELEKMFSGEFYERKLENDKQFFKKREDNKNEKNI